MERGFSFDRLFPDRELSKRGDDGAVLEHLGDINWKLLIVLILVSAVVAYVGDVLGMRIGKKRISIFGLRPRYTSSIVTAVTGVIITLATLAILSTTTDTVRTALFSLKFVQRQITELTSSFRKTAGDAGPRTPAFRKSAELTTKRQELAQVERRLAESEESLRTLQEQLDVLSPRRAPPRRAARSWREKCIALRRNGPSCRRTSRHSERVSSRSVRGASSSWPERSSPSCLFPRGAMTLRRKRPSGLSASVPLW
jgi:uncharacterized protein (DUF3084 family)